MAGLEPEGGLRRGLGVGGRAGGVGGVDQEQFSSPHRALPHISSALAWTTIEKCIGIQLIKLF